MKWKTTHRSFSYEGALARGDIRLEPARTAVLMIDVQKTDLEDKDTPEETAH